MNEEFFTGASTNVIFED